jgi:hypothetical protein
MSAENEVIIFQCVGCKKDLTDDDDCACTSCQHRLPPSLIKACGDSFYYSLRLSTGEIIRFGEASIHGDYAHLTLTDADAGINDLLPYRFERGIDVRIDAIVWCADAPEGS